MKNTIYKRIESLVSLALIILLSVIMVACLGDKKGGKVGKTPGSDRHRDRCSGCKDSHLLVSGLGESLSSSPDSVQLVLDFYSEDSDEDRHGTLNDIQAEGRLYVESFNGFGLCDIPDGDYSVKTLEKGSRNNAELITGLRLEASGPVKVKMRVRYFSFLSAQPVLESCDGHEYANELLGEVVILEADEEECAGKTLILVGAQDFDCD